MASPSPTIVTEDLWPIITQAGGLLTVTRIPALPPAVGLTGVTLVGAQNDQSVSIPWSTINDLLVSIAQAALAAVPTQLDFSQSRNSGLLLLIL